MINKQIVKICHKHGALTIEQVNKNGKDKIGIQLYKCKKCKADSYFNHYLKHKDQIYEKTKEWRLKNPERKRELNRIWAAKFRESNPGEATACKNAYDKAHHDKHRARRAKWSRKQVEEIGDKYIKDLLSRGSGLKWDEIPSELVDLKKAVLQLKRLIKRRKSENV
jgi:hypothetical protein